MKKRLILALGVAVIAALLLAPAAWASMGANNPHTAYNATTSYCLQCHDIHEAAGDYALMWQATVVDVCASCHNVYQQTPSGARALPYPGTQVPNPSPAALRAAYKVSIADRYTHEGHRLGQGGTTGPYTYADGTTTSSADYIPGGGGNMLTRIPSWSYYLSGNWIDPNTYPASGRTALNGLYCASCHSPHGTQFGTAIDLGGGGEFMLLSARPNHTTDTVDASGWTSFTNDGWNWCIRCHKNRYEPTPPNGTAPHNHPSEFCLQCHGNSSDPNIQPDFPHTGATNLLSQYPDALCVQCHVAGLP